MLFSPNDDWQVQENDQLEIYKENIQQYIYKSVFVSDIEAVVVQIERVKKKRDSAKKILLDSKCIHKMDYKIIEVTVASVEELYNMFVSNVSNIILKIDTFDQEDYEIVKKNTLSNYTTSKHASSQSIFDEYFKFIKNAIENNEQIIQQLDKLIFELTNLDSTENKKMFDIETIKEFEKAINELKSIKN